MSFSKQLAVLSLCFLAILQLGCDSTSSTEKLELCFKEMKTATSEFHKNLCAIKDVESAEATLPELEASHLRLANSVQALDEASQTSSRAARNVKREIEDFQKETKGKLKIEFDRLKSDKFLKAVMEPFLHRINAIEVDMSPKTGG